MINDFSLPPKVMNCHQNEHADLLFQKNNNQSFIHGSRTANFQNGQRNKFKGQFFDLLLGSSSARFFIASTYRLESFSKTH